MKFIPISEYQSLTQFERQSHLKLDEKCIEIGGGSANFKGLLAHYLGTEIPINKSMLLCHACHNGKCSNVKHLYWGTYSENLNDSLRDGRKSLADLLKEKYTEDELFQIRSKAAKSRKRNVGPPKLSSDRIEEILKAINDEPPIRGFKQRLSKKLNVSSTQINRYLKMFK